VGQLLTAARPPAARRLLSYGSVYLFWGASYLAIREIVAVAPPFFAAGVRFLAAGLILLVWSSLLRAPRPSPRELRSTAVLGFIMFGVNYGLVFWAEQRVSSGYAAIVAATIPVWMFAGEWLWLRTLRPNGLAFLGMALGISGVALLVLPGVIGSGASGTWTSGALAVLCGTWCWSGGTLLSRKLQAPRSRHRSAGLQMLFGGATLLLFSAATGEFGALRSAASHWSPRLTLDLGYLVFAASIAAFLAYIWLIDHEPASHVASYAYVNPLIAVTLGAVIAGERFAMVQGFGAALVLLGVAATLRARAG